MKKFLMLLVILVILVIAFFVGVGIGVKATEKDRMILTGYKYNTTLKYYKNEKTGVWYTASAKGKTIPSNEYVDSRFRNKLEGLNVENRPAECWKLVTINEIDLKKTDTFSSIVDKYYSDYFRMDYDWYFLKVKEVNGIDDVNTISRDVKFKIPIYEDNKE